MAVKLTVHVYISNVVATEVAGILSQVHRQMLGVHNDIGVLY